MSCIKTGCYLYLHPHQLYAYGDAFEFDGCYIFRVCNVSNEPLNGIKHFTIDDWYHWFDEHKTSQNQNSTLIAPRSAVTNHGYDGVPL